MTSKKSLPKETIRAVMSELGKKSAKKRHKGMTEKQIFDYYSNLRRGEKVDKK